MRAFFNPRLRSIRRINSFLSLDCTIEIMQMGTRLERAFYARPALELAPALLGMRLVHRVEDVRIAGIILETEAYDGEQDLACHARAGRTQRTEVMYRQAGTAYVYFTYGLHWMFNVVCAGEGYPAAVLVRALQMEEWLYQPMPRTHGPALLTRALGISRAQNGLDLCDPGGELWIEQGEPPPPAHIRRKPRVGIGTVPEPWKSLDWNFSYRPS